MKHTAVLLAGSRPGRDEFAASFGTDLKALIPVAGEPMVRRPVRALLASGQIGDVIVMTQAPERIAVPSGSQVRLTYEVGRPPVLAVRIQEVFGMRATPRVARGRVPVLLHLLGPNMRPQQITDDLESFWANTYPTVRGELRRRYPKHSWPDDPLSAEPMRGAKKRRPE